MDGTTLTGDQVKSARFGSAIADIGDINRDSINGKLTCCRRGNGGGWREGKGGEGRGLITERFE